MNAGASSDEKSIILFDGSCNLCNSVVDFIAKHNRRGQFRYIPLESEKASEYINRFEDQGLNKGSMALITDGRIYLRSDAVLHILKDLDGFWPVLYILIIFPRFIRDPLYNLFARYRYKMR